MKTEPALSKKIQDKTVKIGLIGTGIMGGSMAVNLMKAGFELNVYSRTPFKAEKLIEHGAVLKTPIEILAESSDIIITIVGVPEDVEEVYLGEHGVLNSAQEQSILLDMTTSSPELAIEIYETAKAKNIYSLDAPVSGGDIGAEQGTLSIMVGGDRPVFDACIPVFEAMGGNIIFQGKAGCGQSTKMCNQIVLASSMMGLCEALIFAEKADLDLHLVLESITKGAAASWLLSNVAPLIVKQDYSPGFFVKHFLKDMKIAVESAKLKGIKAHGLEKALSLYKDVVARWGDEEGMQALYKVYLDSANGS